MTTASGQLRTKSAVVYDFEDPQGGTGNNSNAYTVTVSVRDSMDADGIADTATDDTITVTLDVTDVNEAPVFADMTTTFSAAENQTAVATKAATDEDSADSVTYALSGTDAGLFRISATGVITFRTAPDFEDPQGGADDDSNAYTFTVTATGGMGDRLLPATQDLTVNVTNIDEAPAAPVVEDQTARVGRLFGYQFAAVEDPEGETVTYTATLSDGRDLPSWLGFNSHHPHLQLHADGGQHRFIHRAGDGQRRLAGAPRRTSCLTVSEAAAPALTSGGATVVGDSLQLVFGDPLSGLSVPAGSAFDVQVTGTAQDATTQARDVSSVAVGSAAAGLDHVVTLTLASPVAAGETVTVAYAPPAVSPLVGRLAGLPVVSFGPVAVANVPAVAGPRLESAVADGSTLTLVFDAQLATAAPVVDGVRGPGDGYRRGRRSAVAGRVVGGDQQRCLGGDRHGDPDAGVGGGRGRDRDGGLRQAQLGQRAAGHRLYAGAGCVVRGR